MSFVQRIICHHSADPSLYNQLERIDTYHKSLDFPKSSKGYYVGYTYFLEANGAVIQTRADDEVQAHTKGWNDGSIGICLAGDFDIAVPTPEQMQSLKVLLNEKCKQYNLLPTDVLGHKNFRLTSCPGKLLPDSLIRSLITIDISQLKLMLELLKAQVRLALLKRNLGKVVEKEDTI